MKLIPVVCFQLNQKGFVCANSKAWQLLKDRLFEERFLSCGLDHLLYTKHSKTIPRQQENKGQRSCF